MAVWIKTTKFDPLVAAMYGRHYSSKSGNKSEKDWVKYGICPTGESMTLIVNNKVTTIIDNGGNYVE